jgi:hypothetical protein
MTSNQAEPQQARADLAADFRRIARLGMHEGVCNRFTVMLPGRRRLTRASIYCIRQQR